ncbi:TPA: Crp/Fnr family transcriptional regulator [Listeria monocytogenes]|nr:Crp/Fnr family transcriptional regulator [Listeria monocytogenes]EAD0633131.1 Crp/Fnr family transcriptional regulator [Listeria monocytogenes]ECO8240686.1 Crp/Fnr family transcriptional regulator [Listeria monocytogenes]EFS0526638.1 Crp/Fnr family transcriptional regulator [Listeria monocytogenes]EGT8214360.1 Crp/Fnr family transcriptional regulator [Listeria monocytogenes]
MNFLELHQFIKEDSLIYSWIKRKFHLSTQRLEAGQDFLMNNEHIIIVEKGLLIQESMDGNSNVQRLFVNQQVIFTTKESLLLLALESTTFNIVLAEELFDMLEKQQLLQHFFLQIAENFERDLECEKMLVSTYPEKRIEMVLTKIINLYHLDPVENPTFPKWLKIYILAKLAKCSVTKTSVIINKLVERGVINVNSTPWLLT